MRTLCFLSLLLIGCANTNWTAAAVLTCTLAQASAVSEDLAAYVVCDKAVRSRTTVDEVACAAATLQAGTAHLKQVPACMPPPAPAPAPAQSLP